MTTDTPRTPPEGTPAATPEQPPVSPAVPPAPPAPADEIGGPQGPEPTRFGDWEKGGRCTDF